MAGSPGRLHNNSRESRLGILERSGIELAKDNAD
jgi:hypothetical protein